MFRTVLNETELFKNKIRAKPRMEKEISPFQRKAYKELSDEEVEGTLKTLTSLEQTILKILYAHPNALSLKEIRNWIILDVNAAVARIYNYNQTHERELKGLKEPLREEHVLKAVNGKPAYATMRIDVDLGKIDAFVSEWIKKEKELFGEGTKPPFYRRLEIIASCLSKCGISEIPGYKTIKTSLSSLLKEGYVLERVVTEKKASALYTLNPSVYKYLRRVWAHLPEIEPGTEISPP